jgi:hypothetical protein
MPVILALVLKYKTDSKLLRYAIEIALLAIVEGIVRVLIEDITDKNKLIIS